jgi:signal transduction histidine kinase
MHALRQAGSQFLMRRRTVRTRLAMLYGAVFLVSGAALLAIANLPLRSSQSVALPNPPLSSGQSVSSVADGSSGNAIAVAQHGADVRLLAVASIIALVVLAALSLGFGWLMAGRLLRPLRTITAKAREISATRLDERLALQGPGDEFKELGDTLDDLFGRLEASFESQRHFVANASHELRTPLTAERTLLQVALADPQASADTLRSTCKQVLALGAHEERLIEALLSLARSERGVEDWQVFDLASITENVLQARRQDAERRDIRIEATLDEATGTGEPSLVEALIANLVDNALQHNIDGGRVDIGTTQVAGSPLFSIVNTGPVVPNASIERLFEPFRRAGADRTRSDDGHGLGLSIVRAVVDAHGATIKVEPRSGGGLRVEVAFAASPPS